MDNQTDNAGPQNDTLDMPSSRALDLSDFADAGEVHEADDSTDESTPEATPPAESGTNPTVISETGAGGAIVSAPDTIINETRICPQCGEELQIISESRWECELCNAMSKFDKPVDGPSEAVKPSFNPTLKAPAVKEQVYLDRMAAAQAKRAGIRPSRRLSFVRADSVKPKRLQWLWRGKVPLGKITTFAGLPGEAKSLVSIDIAAVITTGRPKFGDETANTLPGPRDVLFVVSEDDFDDTVVPRLIAAGADLSRVHFVEVHGLGGRKTLMALDVDMDVISDRLKECPEICLIVIDPITNHLGQVKMNEEQPVRDLLASKLQIADIGVVLIAHLNKKEGLKAIQRVSGASAFIGVARSSWIFTSDPADPSGIREMLPLKNNLVKREGGLQFTVESKPMTIEGEAVDVPFVAWKGRTDRTADSALQPHEKKAFKLSECTEWLQEYLLRGRMLANDVFTDGKKKSFSPETIRRAKKALGVISEQIDGRWEWYLPDESSDASDCQPEGVDHLTI